MLKNNSWLKFFIIFFISLSAAVVFSVYFILNSTWFWSAALKHLPVAQLSSGSVQSLSLGRTQVTFPARFNFKNVKIQIKGGNDSYDVDLDSVVLDASSIVLKTGSKLSCQAGGIK